MDEAKKHIKNLLSVITAMEEEPVKRYPALEAEMVNNAEEFLEKDVDDGWEIIKELMEAAEWYEHTLNGNGVRNKCKEALGKAGIEVK